MMGYFLFCLITIVNNKLIPINNLMGVKKVVDAPLAQHTPF